VRITYDPAKNEKNIASRALSFERVRDLDWPTSFAAPDTRRDYGEERLRILALLEGRLHMVVITHRGDAVHVISFRRANRKEVRFYEKVIGAQGDPTG
jgi:uncharacterized DUF497 family protein